MIDFTAKLFGLKLYEAAQKLAYDFGITQDKPPDKAMQEKLNKKSEAQRLRENEKLCFSALMAYYKLLQEWMVVYAPRTPEDDVDSRFAKACHWLSYVEYLVDLLIMGDSYERTEVIDMVMTDDKLKKLQTYLEKVNKEGIYMRNVLILGIIGIAFYGVLIYLIVLVIKALRKYLNSSEVRKEKAGIKKSLGEILKEHRVRCKMTQEFVAESLGVSRQAVSKWENGTSDPSTSNLFALAKLFGVSVEELLKDIE